MADDYSVFDMVGAPVSIPLTRAVTPTAIALPIGRRTWDDLSLTNYAQVGSEWIRVTGGGSPVSRNSILLTAAVTNVATELPVDNTADLDVNAALGVTDRLAFAVGGEVVHVLAVSGSVLTVRRGAEGTTPAAAPSGAALNYMDTVRSLDVVRGQFGTAATAHAAWSPINRLYRPDDFLRLSDAGQRTFPVQVGGAVVGNVVQLRGFFDAGNLATGVIMAPGVAGAIARFHQRSSNPSLSVDVYVNKVADASGAPITPTASWNAGGTLNVGDYAGCTLTYGNATTTDLRWVATGIELLTAGWYVFEVSIYHL